MVGKFILHYSSSREEIRQMAASAHRNLKPGGCFVTVIPDIWLHSMLYNCSIEHVAGKSVLEEGDKVKVTLWAGGKPYCSFENFYWKLSTYEQQIRLAGFRSAFWHKMIVSDEGIQKYPSGFWTEYLDRPTVRVLEAVK